MILGVPAFGVGLFPYCFYVKCFDFIEWIVHGHLLIFHAEWLVIEWVWFVDDLVWEKYFRIQKFLSVESFLCITIVPSTTL
jgi:hypothetical protein